MLMQRFFSRFGFIAALFATVAVTATVASHAQEIGSQARAVFEPLIASSCGSSNPCLQWTNTSSGPGLKGISSKGKGVIGQTNFSSTSSANGQAGVQGLDKSTSGSFNAGVLGTSTLGVGVTGTSVNGNALVGIATGAGSGLYVNSPGTAEFAIAGFNAVDARTTNKSSADLFGRAGVFGHDDTTDGGHLNVGVAGASINGIGVEGVSSNFVAANMIGGNASLSLPALSIVGNRFADFIDACPPSTANPCDLFHSAFDVDSDGSVFAEGFIKAHDFISTGACLLVQTNICPDGGINITTQYQKSGTCVSGCALATTTHAGRAVVSYVATQSLPSIDVGPIPWFSSKIQRPHKAGLAFGLFRVAG